MKEHKKLYKAGKLWLTATIALATWGIMLTSNASADTTTPTQTATVAQQANQSSTTMTATTQQQFAATNGQATNNENKGYLDKVELAPSSTAGNVQVVATGWHAADASQTLPYRYAIMFDKTTNSELARVKVAGPDIINRPDVQKVYPGIANSQKAGFRASLEIPYANLGDSLVLVSRYSNDTKNGEGLRTDYWLPVHIGMNNYAYLDGVELNGNQVRVHGWHATNQAAIGNRSHHYIIAYDKTQNREIARQEVTDNNVRGDVAKAYPGVFNANQSGFDLNFDLNPAFVNDEVLFISRWTGAADANSNYVDKWFDPQWLFGDDDDRANLDQFVEKDGQMTIAGWHADNLAYGKKYHYIIVLDHTAGIEVARQLVTTNQSRPDVAKVFPHIANAANSGFNITIPYNKAWDGHELLVVSRWTNDQAGNGSTPVDHWFDPKQLVAGQPAQPAPIGQPAPTAENAAHLKSFKLYRERHAIGAQISPNFLSFIAEGWHATNDTKKYRRFIMLDNTTNQVLSAKQFICDDMPMEDWMKMNHKQPDVAKRFGQQYKNAADSGFFIEGYMTDCQIGHKYTLISQYADDENGTNANEARFYLDVLNPNRVTPL